MSIESGAIPSIKKQDEITSPPAACHVGVSATFLFKMDTYGSYLYIIHTIFCVNNRQITKYLSESIMVGSLADLDLDPLDYVVHVVNGRPYRVHPAHIKGSSHTKTNKPHKVGGRDLS